MTVSRPRAVFGVTKQNARGVLARAQAVYTGITANAALFANPTVTPAALLALINAMDAAQTAAMTTKAKGAATVRDTKRDVLWTALNSLCTYVQGLADAGAADHAIMLIEAAGFLVAQVAVHQKPILQAQLTTTQGTVKLIANATVLLGKASASKKATFHWQYSTDGKTWIDGGSTPYAKTSIPNLTLMTTYTFRVSVTVGETTGQWSQAVSLLVH